MKPITYTILLIVGAFLLQQILPWWILPLYAGVLAFVLKIRPLAAFLLGLLCGALLWGGMAFWLDLQNNSRLSVRMGELFGGLSPNMMIVATALPGAVFAALGACTGSLGRQYVSTE
ncbi:MAG: hypothetical protein MRY78_05635 [Saprospiraceae bacterium]|nr:hypothetical protein [Saprospiraceae bacterium]